MPFNMLNLQLLIDDMIHIKIMENSNKVKAQIQIKTKAHDSYSN